jgi:hypothetical protein
MPLAATRNDRGRRDELDRPGTYDPTASGPAAKSSNSDAGIGLPK